MAAIKQKWEYFESQLDKELASVPLLVFIQAKTDNKVHRAHIALGFVAFMFLFVLFGIWDSWIVNFVGFVLPAYLSIKAIESNNKEDDTQWLTYWLVFGLFTILEGLLNCIIPWYFVIKYCFLIWLMAPVFNGARVFYYVVFRPIWGRVPNLPGSAQSASSKHPEEESEEKGSDSSEEN